MHVSLNTAQPSQNYGRTNRNQNQAFGCNYQTGELCKDGERIIKQLLREGICPTPPADFLKTLEESAQHPSHDTFIAQTYEKINKDPEWIDVLRTIFPLS